MKESCKFYLHDFLFYDQTQHHLLQVAESRMIDFPKYIFV